jgi:hypothetical protein
MSPAQKTRVSRRSKTVQPLQVYDGQKLIGELKDHGRGSVDAFGVDQSRRVKIGTFQNRTDAMRAISEGIGSSCTNSKSDPTGGMRGAERVSRQVAAKPHGCLDAARKRVLGPVAYTTGLPEHFLTAGRNQPLASK